MRRNKELLFTGMKETTRNVFRVKVSVDMIWSSVLDQLISSAHYAYEYSYRVSSRIYKSRVKSTLRYTSENYQHINDI